MHAFAPATKSGNAGCERCRSGKKPAHSLTPNPAKGQHGCDSCAATGAARPARSDFAVIPVFSKAPAPVQTGLAISSPDDAFEYEADRVAAAVMAPIAAPAALPGSPGQVGKRMAVQASPAIPRADILPGSAIGSAVVQRYTGGAAPRPTQFDQSLQHATTNGGTLLPGASRTFMESRFGRDFSHVRVHADARANALASDIHAQAFTVGNHIFFANSQFQPDNQPGQHLLAHELAHVVQQGDGRVARQIQRITRCGAFPDYDHSQPRRSFNCAGLALRTYQWIDSANATRAEIARHFIAPRTNGPCGPGEVKFWLWEFDFNVVNQIPVDTRFPLPGSNRQFHIVSGRMGPRGEEPAWLYSKNGQRVVEQSGTINNFEPAQLESSRSTKGDNAVVTGRYAFRTNITLQNICAGCHPAVQIGPPQPANATYAIPRPF